MRRQDGSAVRRVSALARSWAGVPAMPVLVLVLVPVLVLVLVPVVVMSVLVLA